MSFIGLTVPIVLSPRALLTASAVTVTLHLGVMGAQYFDSKAALAQGIGPNERPTVVAQFVQKNLPPDNPAWKGFRGLAVALFEPLTQRAVYQGKMLAFPSPTPQDRILARDVLCPVRADILNEAASSLPTAQF